MCFVSETVNIQGCGYKFLSGGVGMPAPSSAETIYGRDIGDLQEPGLPG